MRIIARSTLRAFWSKYLDLERLFDVEPLPPKLGRLNILITLVEA